MDYLKNHQKYKKKVAEIGMRTSTVIRNWNIIIQNID